jgi:hypothetical protein
MLLFLLAVVGLERAGSPVGTSEEYETGLEVVEAARTGQPLVQE